LKGFARILEAVLASIVLLTVLVYFFVHSHYYYSWEDTNLRIRMHDTLASLYKSGELQNYVRNNDADGINNRIQKIFPKTVGYSVEIRGIPNPIIYLSCNCTRNEAMEIEKTILKPVDFNYTTRNINIRIKQASIDNIDPRTNVLLVRDYMNIAGHEAKINQFLEKGGTIFLFSDITQEALESNKYLIKTFNLSWKDSPTTAQSKFYSTIDPEKPSYYISKYYINITGYETEFSNFHSDSVNKIDANEKTIVISTAGTNSFVQVNYYLGSTGRGQSVWFSDYSYDNQNINRLFKAAVMWASGRSYSMDVFEKTPGPIYGMSGYIVSGHDIFEPFEINLMFWRVFY
jgi:hypothetical protein